MSQTATAELAFLSPRASGSHSSARRGGNGTPAARTISRFAIALAVFLGGFVIREPAPYEVFLAFLMFVFVLFGMRLSKIAITLATLFMLFNAGGLLSMFQMADFKEAPVYLAVSLFLGLSSVFFCAAIEADMSRIRTIYRGYAASAVITSVFGIAGYLALFPGADFFTRYGRARGLFEDPNVFGPFLILPALYLMYGILYRSPSLMPARLIMLMVLVFGIFLSFSRAAWGLLPLSGMIFYFLLFVSEPRSFMRVRMIFVAGFALATLVAMIAIALQFENIAALFEERAQIVQDYDGARLGRFARHAIGFEWALERPFGIGPLEFGLALGEDTHNIWVKSLMAYGWLGFTAYLTMTVITLFGAGRILMRDRPWQPYLQCAYAAFLGHLIIAWVIDIDHWRHVYLIIGVIWGCMALEGRRWMEKGQSAAHLPLRSLSGNR